MSKKTVFVDTGAWFAIADKSDQHHQPAKEHLRSILESGDRLVTSSLIVHETVMLLSRRLSKDAALKFLDLIDKDENVEVMQAMRAWSRMPTNSFDMSCLMDEKPFDRLRDASLFLKASVAYGTVVWPGNIDIAPETLYVRSVPV